MLKKAIVTIKVFAICAVALFALTATLSVLDVLTTEHARQILNKVLSIIGIFTVASLAILFIAGTAKK
jgi:uncharacterized protein (UPF0212 family)